MTTERIDIELTDKVDTGIGRKLKSIATESRNAGTAVQQLQRLLNQMDSGALGMMQSKMQSATRAVEEQSRQLANLTANTRMQEANLRVLNGQLDQARNSLAAMTAQQQQAAAATAQQATATKGVTDALGAQQTQTQRTTLGWQDYNTGLAQTGRNAQLARHHLLNLGFQLQDIGVSLASGQNPLTVAVQQGAQIQGIAQQANVGIGGLARGVAALLAPMLPLAAGVGAVAGGLKIMSSELSKTNNIKAYSESLGLTAQQIKKLDGDTVTMTDTFKAFFTTLGELTGAGKLWDSFTDSATKAFKNVVGAGVDAFNLIGAASSAVMAVIVNDWEQTDPRIRNIIARMWNSLVNIFETGVNAVINGINQIIGAMNKVSTIKIDPFENITLPKISTDQQEKEYKSAGDAFADAFRTSFEARSKEFDSFYEKWQANSVKGAKDRIKKAFEEGGGGKSGESRAAALAKVNAQLDNELQRMTMLQPAREAQQRYDQIEEQMIGRRIKLTAEESNAIKAKIAQLQSARDVQQQTDRIYEQAVGPARDYAATLAAADALLAKNAISQQQYNGQIAAAKDAYENAIDPLRQYTREMEFERSLMGMSNQQRDLAVQKREIEQNLLQRGIVLTDEQTAALTRQIEETNRAQQVQAAYNDVYAGTQGRLNDIKMSAEGLNMALQNGTIGLSFYQSQMASLGVEAARLRIAMDQALPGDEFNATFGRLLEGYQGFTAGAIDALGNLFTTMQDGMANALAGAIMGTQDLGEAIRNVAQSAVQELLAGLIKLGMQYVINAAIGQTVGMAAVAGTVAQAAVAANAWAPAAALASLATLGANAGPATIGMGSTMVAAKSFAALSAVGFENGGYTGDYGRQTVAGVVHGGEYVMTADTVNRVGIDQLEAIQRGASIAGPSTTGNISAPAGMGGMVNIVINNNAPGVEVTQSQSRNAKGETDINVQIDSLENALASRVASGRGPLHNATRDAFDLNSATVAR